jgi:hypothetical protein
LNLFRISSFELRIWNLVARESKPLVGNGTCGCGHVRWGG